MLTQDGLDAPYVPVTLPCAGRLCYDSLLVVFFSVQPESFPFVSVVPVSYMPFCAL
jgi:hypothetical protein